MAATLSWGDEITYSFDTRSWGAKILDTNPQKTANWTSGKDGAQYTSGRGVQVTTGASGANATSPIEFLNISKIVVGYSTNASSGAGTIKIKVGSETEKSFTVTKTGGTTDRDAEFTYEKPESGSVKITVNCTTNSIYIHTIKIVYGVSVAAPTFTPKAGTYTGEQKVAISTTTDGATIYYTIDGTTPTNESETYSTPLTISEKTTVKAIAYKDGKSSDVAEAVYTIIPAGAENVTLWSEDFSSYSAGNIPTGGIYSYSCSKTGTKIYADDLAGGASPELLVAKSGGTFTAVVPLKNVVGDLTLTYKTNANSLNVSSTTEGITGSITSSTVGTHSMTFKGITASTTSITIVFKATSGNNVRLDDIVLTGLQMPNAVSTPVISPAGGTFFGSQNVEISCATVGAKIYYTLNGTDPTTSSTEYTGAITIDKTTTLKAIAFKDGESSNVATAEYTIAPTYENNNAANVAATSTDSPVRLTLTEALVVYKNGYNTYLKDASGGMLIYGENNLNVGDKVTGHVDGDLTLYNGLPEIKNPVFSVSTVSQNNEVTATVVDAADLKANPMKYVSQYVKVSPAKFAEDFTGSTSNATNANFTVGETELILRNSFKLEFKVSAEKKYYVAGMATIYNGAVQLYPTNAETDIVEIPVVAKIGNETYETLQAAVDAAKQAGGDQTITLLSDINEETVTIQEVAGFKLTVDGKKDDTSNYTVGAAIVVAGLRGNGGSNTNGASVTLQNIAFVNAAARNAIQPSHYPHHLTIQDCTYTGSETSLNNWFLNVDDGPLYGATIKNVTVEITRLIQGNLGLDVVFENIVATNNCKAGFNIKTEGTVLIKNCQISTAKYAFRDYKEEYVGTITLEGNTFTSTSTEADEGAIVNRGGKVGTAHINVVSGNYSGQVLVLNNKAGILAISGGLFSVRVADEYCAEGKICAANPDEETKATYPYIVRDGQYTAQVGEQKFETFAEAVAALTEENNVITLLADVAKAYTLTAGQTLNVNLNGHNLMVVAPDGYLLKTTEVDGVTTYTTEAIPVVIPTAPVVFHDSGEYEAGLSVPMYAQAGEIYYTINGRTKTKYTAPLTIKEDTKITAWAEINGVESDKVTKTFTIVTKAEAPSVEEGYYSIKNGTGKYINVAGRKTVTFTDAIDDKAGTVLKVKTGENGQVDVLRSQGVDLPGYADRAMNYVPKFVKLIVDKLHAEGSGAILGENGLDAIMKKFNESFDYHLYIENANGNDNAGYRIYGKTPSMKPVVDFYAENKANVDYKLPQLEAFINSAIQKVLQKTGGRGSSILTKFKLHDIWQNMGETLTEPVEDDAASIAKFYEEVLASEANVWNFAYQTAMIYWNNVKNHPRYEELKGKLGEYAKYIEKVENIRPNFKYYIVANTAGNDVDFISDGNIDIQNNAARATWTLESRKDFKVTFSKENSINLGRELYTTLYTDFAYTVPEKVKAYKVTAIDEKTGLATKEEITGVIPAQTPVLLQMIVDPKTVTDADLTQTLTLSTEAGTAVTGNLLQGPDWLINKYQIKAKQVEELFGYVHDFLKLADVEALYDSYVKEYEYLMIRNAGTVNNKYFFGLSGDDIAEADVNVCQLAKQGNPRQRLAFYHNLGKVEANKAFIPSETIDPVYLSLIGDVTRDGKVNISDVTAQIDIILGKDTPEDNYDYDAADVDGNGEIKIKDVTDLIDIILGKDKN